MAATQPRVFVTGAGGRTGKLVVQKLKQRGTDVRGLVRRPEQAAELGEGIVVGDVLRPETWEPALEGCQKLVILTSAVPKMRPQANPSDPPAFYFEEGAEPERVDWDGQKLQVDLARKHGLDQVVLVSSMGVTKADHPLNRIAGADGAPANILLWKRMAEEYLVASGMAYTVIHPGGLLDEPGGRRQLLVGKGDAFLQTDTRAVPRADVAEVVCQALFLDESLNKSFDLVSRPEGQGDPTKYFDVLFDQTTAGL